MPDKTKFYKYKSATSATVTIPIRMAKMLGWTHKDEIIMELKTIDGNIGIFLYKKKANQ